MSGAGDEADRGQRQIVAVVPHRDPERLGQPARAIAEVALPAAPSGHDAESRRRLEGPDEDRARLPVVPRDHVDAVMDAVGHVDVEGSARTEHRFVAAGPAAERVRGGIVAAQVGLGLDDDAAGLAAIDGGDQKRPEQAPGGLRRVPEGQSDGGQLSPALAEEAEQSGAGRLLAGGGRVGRLPPGFR